jgi:hypothetical protein
MGLQHLQQAAGATFGSLPIELREIIWQYALRLNATNRGRTIRLVVTRQLTPNPDIEWPHAPFDVTFTYTSPDIPVPQSPTALRLINQQSNAEVQSLLNRDINARYIADLRYLQGVAGDAGGEQRILFHPRLDTIRMDIPAMMALHIDWANLYTRHQFLRRPINGLQHVQNLALPRTTDDDGNTMNLPILHVFIPFSQIPVPPARGSSEGSQSSAESRPTEAEVAFTNHNLFEETAYFPNAVVRFVEPARSDGLVGSHLLFLRNELGEMIPDGQVANGAYPGNENSNMAQRISNIIDDLWEYIDDWLNIYR